MPTPDLDHLMHHADLKALTQAKLEQTLAALTLAEQAYAADPTPTNTTAYLQAGENYQTALHNRNAVKGTTL